MSTTYYRVRGGIRIEPALDLSPDWWAIEDATTHERVGTVRGDYLSVLADRDDRAGHRSNGRIAVYATGPDSEWVVSEYGEAVTLGDLRRGVAP